MNLIKILKNSWLSKIMKQIFIKKTIRNNLFPGSKKYWEQRYLANLNSGAGSYGRLAQFKADILNEFVRRNDIGKVIEFGCGDGNQLDLANYRYYQGFDVSNRALELCKAKFKDDDSKFFYEMDNVFQIKEQGDLVISLDVLYHLIEDEIFDDYMHRIFNSSTKYVIIYSSNYNDHFAPHVKCRKFTDWIDKNVFENWELKTFIKNRYPFDEKKPNQTSMSDFYIYKKKS